MISKKFIKFWIIVLIILACAGLSLLYFFHMSVRIDSDYDIDVVYIKEENSGKTVSRHSTKFSHTAMYGKYKYTFVANNQKFIIDVFKTNDYEHYTADIEIKSIDSGINMFEISVGRNGVIEASEEHRFGESECIYISVGP
jgi:uncharacterized protein YxeA